jgi:DNA-3-methyladenine glycosylase
VSPTAARGVQRGALTRTAEPAGLGAAFYDRPVVDVARDLVGCLLTHGDTAGVIVETEAYHHSEPACHAYVGLTSRTSTLFGLPGIAYVYRSYGIHALLNAVCEEQEVGAAVLIRALEPIAGLEIMRLRRPGIARDRDLCSGPGKLTQALDIELGDNRSDLSGGPVRISGRPSGWTDPPIVADRRIGITRAMELPWRFCVADSRFLSRPLSRWSGPLPRGAA